MASTTLINMLTTTPANTSNLITPSPDEEGSTFHVAVVVVLSIVSCVGIIGNLFIIGSICLYKRLRVRGNAFIVNLAMADLLIVAYIMPVGLASSQFKENPFSQTMCDINAFIIMTTCGVSTQTLMLIALERYFHICKMHIYRKAFTPRLIGLYIAIVWIYTSAWTCQGWTGWTQYVYGVHVHLCIFAGPESISYDVCLSFFGMLLPMIVLAVCYYKIFRTVVRSRRAITAHRKKASGDKVGPGNTEASRLKKPEAEKQAEREYRLIVTLFTIVVVFSTCWLPACAVVVLSGVWEGMPTIMYQLCMWFAVSNSAVNSIVYGLLNYQFRKGYMMVVQIILCCGHMPKKCCTLTAKGKKKKAFYPISIWLAVCNSGMNSFIYGILNKNFRTGYKQLLQHLLCCMVFKKRGKCRECTGLLETKDSSSESHGRSDATRHTKGSSVSPSSQSDSSNMRSGGSTDTRDITLADSHQSLAGSPAHTQVARPPSLRPIQYQEEPQSGAPIIKQNGVHVITHNQSASASDLMSVVQTDGQTSPIVMTESFFSSSGTNPPSQTGSQSSLIRRSLQGSEAGSVDNTDFVHPVTSRPSSATTWSHSQGQGQRPPRSVPPASVARPRPTSAQREVSMSNVVLETKM